MCTAMILQSNTDETFFGRTMDFSHDIIPQLYKLPAFYEWSSCLDNRSMKNKYQIIGLGQELDGIFGLFDGVNEKGVAAAALYFAGSAQYETLSNQSTANSVSSIDFLHFILASCSSVAELPALLKNINIVGVADPVTHTVAPLHWIVTDRSGACAVIESTTKGVELFNNPIGVMANSPDFNWHLTNLRNFMMTTPTQVEETAWDNMQLTPFGQAGGTTTLPGGFTSPERFVRVSYLKSHLPKPMDGQEALTACFHVLESVSIPKGAVITSQNTFDYTKYTAFINMKTCEYFYKTYDDLTIYSAGLW